MLPRERWAGRAPEFYWSNLKLDAPLAESLADYQTTCRSAVLLLGLERGLWVTQCALEYTRILKRE